MDLDAQSDVLVFYVNGKRITDPSPDPEATLLQYIRRTCLPGTKEGCGHGGCGSCTVMISKYDVIRKSAIHYAVNACLFPLCAAHGLAITTVDGVGSPRTGLHEVQKRMLESHALQCGFCTPGFVMSAFTLLRNNPRPSKEDVERALEGNLCRCTGYRPILDALSPFTEEGCSMGQECCKNKKLDDSNAPEISEITALSDKSEETQLPIFPPELQLPNEYHSKFAHFGNGKMTWYRPTTLAGLVSLKDKFPDAPIVMGNTTLAQFRLKGNFSRVLYAGDIADLKLAEETDKGITFGAAVTISELRGHLTTLCGKLEERKRRHFPSLLVMTEKYGSEQIRNVATLSGSIQSGRSNSDVITALTAFKASVTVASVSGERSVGIEELTLKDNEVISCVTIPFTDHEDCFGFYKQAERRTFSLAIINCGFYLRLKEDKVLEMRLCFGGFAPGKSVLANKTSTLAIGRAWDDKLLHEMIPVMVEELTGRNKTGDEAYKVAVATACLYKFYTSVRNPLTCVEDKGRLLKDIAMPPCSSTQVYHPCTDDGQPDIDPVGRPIPNVASGPIVAGEAIYVDDMPSLQGELFLSLVMSDKAHANITRIDPTEALQIEGVHSFIDHTDVPGLNKFGFGEREEEFFASKEVVYVGQPIGAILANSREIAHRAVKIVKVEYEELDAILTIEDAIKAESFICKPIKMDNGDIDQGFSESDQVLEGEYSTGFQEHFYLEPAAVLVVPKIEHEEIEVYCCTQGLDGVQQSIAEVLNVSRSKVKCVTKRVGGGFGGKQAMRTSLIAGPAAIAAYKTRRPVRCTLPRETDMLITGKRHPFVATYKIGVNNDGGINALDVSMYSNAGITSDTSYFVMLKASDTIEGCYNIPNVRFRGHVCKTNTPSNTSFRALGRPQATVIIEEILFKVACSLNMTQEKLRERNMIKEGHVLAFGVKMTGCTVPEMWKQLNETSEFQRRRKEADDFNRTNRWKKRGVAMTTVRYGVGTGVMAMNQGCALVNIYLDGSVLVSHGGVELGQGLNTKIIQVASRVLGVAMEKIHTVEASTSTVPNATVTGASFATDLYSRAVMDACNTLNERLKSIKDKNPDAKWEDLVGKAYMTRVQLSATGYFKREMAVDFDIEKKVGDPASMGYTYGVACSEVEIDVLTGENQVLQTDILFDIGKSLNPGLDIGQIEGAFVQGFGMVTTEVTEIDGKGRMTNCSPLKYKIPNVRSIPRKLNVTLLKNYDIKNVVYSSKGVGEGPYLCSASVINAIKDAVLAARAQIGVHGYFRLDCPATVQRIREACGNQLKL